MRSYVASQNLKESDSEGHPDSENLSDSEGQDLDKLKDRGVEGLKIKSELF